ncbi:molybdopterin-dependent oxidoreductase [Sphingomonas sp. ZT3P38]|uniref:molybdopterin-dependent oxidoreductase n=1 Tax=Parasphingomonas zepuensis TaxID=3096161 RepID=UPI002FC73192
MDGLGAMDRLDFLLASRLARRRLLALGGLAGGSAVAAAATPSSVRLVLNRGVENRALATDFPQKKAMIVQRNRPPLLETPMAVFDRGVFTPNDQFYVRWHWGDIPLEVDATAFRLDITGEVGRPISLGLNELLRMPRLSYAAVNQCSGNSRAFFEPRVPGAQWAHGAMGNAMWEGVSLRAVLDRAGVRPGAGAVRFGGLDRPLTDVDPFEKSLALDHARDGEVMIAFAMNGEQLPMLNGFPLRLVVPGWYSTYWVKALNRIEVLAGPDENYWMAKAYKVPTAADANVEPGAKDFPHRTDQHDGAAIMDHVSGQRGLAAVPPAVAGARHRNGRGLRRQADRHIERWRPDMGRRATRAGPGAPWLSPVRRHPAGSGTGSPDIAQPLYQHRRANPGDDPQLESRRLYARLRGDDSCHPGLNGRSTSLAWPQHSCWQAAAPLRRLAPIGTGGHSMGLCAPPA